MEAIWKRIVQSVVTFGFGLGFLVLWVITLQPSLGPVRGQLATSSEVAPIVVNEVEHANRYDDEYSVYNCGKKHSGLNGTLPHFLVIGVHKGGSTALYGYLNQHGHIRPAVCKETNYLSNERMARKRGINGYRRFFRDLSETPWMQTGEGTPSYFRLPHVPALAAEWLPNVRLIVTLRDPVKRFISHFVGFREREKTSLSCDAFFQEEVNQLQECAQNPNNDWRTDPRHVCLGKLNHLAIARSMYTFQLLSWLEHFPPHRIQLVQAESLFSNTEDTMNEVAKFLKLREFTSREMEHFRSTDVGSHHMDSSVSKECDVEKLARFFSTEVHVSLYPLLDQTYGSSIRNGWVPWSTDKFRE